MKIKDKKLLRQHLLGKQFFFKLKKKKQTRTDLTLGLMVKAKLYRQNLTQKHTPIHSQKKEKEKN